MKLLFLHCDYIRFKPLKKALKSAAELSENEKKEHEVKEVLVVLTAVEKGDTLENVKDFIENVKDVSKQVNAKNIVLYPYAHLSSNLSAPYLALEIMKKAEESLSKDFKVSRAPFGYYKEFELKVKGHPLSELSREIRSNGQEFQKPTNKSEKQPAKEEDYDPKQLLNEISKSRLDTSKLNENDHRILGQRMDLYSFNEVAPGMIFWHNNGLIIKDELINFWKEMHKKNGYQEISTPQIMDKKLWQISGHWDKYKENNFLTYYENKPAIVKPMNCPGGMLVYRSGTKSYKDLPLRIGELGIVHRQELSGVIGGLFRLVQFTQDDAHIFCTEEQVEQEISKIMDLIDLFYKKFNLPYAIELSTRPERRIGSDEVWDKAEKLLEAVLKKKKVKFKLNPGDGAFYGPKIDFHIKDSLGRSWQCATIQLDFQMPERFELEYVDKDNKKKRPVMLHRVIYGALERFIGIIIEHLNGRLPTWLSPVQVRVLSFTDRNKKYAESIIKKIKDELPRLRIDYDFGDSPIPGKVKDAEMMRVSYTIVAGDKEEKEKNIAVRKDGKIKTVKLEEFVRSLRKEIDERK
ncbi:MAG TPA: threonine--tRNA ligase [Candidatus Nanoarchaeia archaeon]|nr:threonine--tRNA ligase [Candidatus Nanoarchaeia archaeon]